MGLVWVAFLIEVIIFSFLIVELRQTEELSNRETHAKMVIAKCQNLPELIFDAVTALGGFAMTRSEEFESKYEDVLTKIATQVRTIEILVHDNPKQQEALKKVQEATGKGIGFLESYRNQMRVHEDTPSLTSASGLRTSIQFTVDTLMSSIKELTQEEIKISENAPAIQSQNHDLIYNSFYLSIAFNGFLAVALGLYVYRDIVNRISVMVDNTQRLAKKEKLLPKVQGADEISHLDTVFHDMADQLERAAKHKQELISMVSHDLRSPLMSVQVSLELIASGALGELQQKMTREINAASRNVKRLIELINDLLDIEKMEAGKLEMYVTEQNVLEMIDESFDSVRGSADKKNITLQKPLIDTKVYADKQRLVQVLVNLLSNAIKFSPEEGEINVEVIDKENETIIKVCDQGPGIPPEQIDKIFDRFQQVSSSTQAQEKDRARKGTGLGLAICKAIVEGHEGRLGVESEVGKGSAFWIALPKPISRNP